MLRAPCQELRARPGAFLPATRLIINPLRLVAVVD